MKCGVHSEREALGTCVECGIAFCEECKVVINDKNVCKKCVDAVIKKGQRNPVVAALLSFIFPGAGQVYNGQIGKAAIVFFTWWLFIPWIYGIVDAYLVAQKITKGQITTKSTSVGCLVVLIAFFVVLVPGCALLSAIAIPNLLRAKMAANDALAKATLRSLSTASESFATENNGRYPSAISELVYATPPYLTREYCNETISGYSFRCAFSPDGYQFTANPETEGTTGSQAYTVITGGVLTP